MSFNNDLLRRVREYVERYGLTQGKELGYGVHGSVFVAESHRESERGQSALKVHHYESFYCREREVYLRLQELEVRTVAGCRVPQLLRYDDDLWVIEMTIVKRPFALDFAGAFLDEPP